MRARQTESERRIAAIEELVQRLDTAADPATRAVSQELVRAVMELHGTALERMLTALRKNGAAGATIVDQLARDEVVASVLLLHDLHPVDLETRVRGALEKTRPYLKTHGGNVELVGIDDSGVVRLRMEGSCHGCPSSGVTLKLAIEQAIHEAAPDVSAILVEGQTAPGRPSTPELITLGSVGGGDGEATWQDVPELTGLAEAGTRRMELGGTDVLFCLAEDNLYAYGARCPACDADLVTAELEGRTLICPACDQAYDIVQAGRAAGRSDVHLEPFPVLTREGRTQVALPAPRIAVAV